MAERRSSRVATVPKQLFGESYLAVCEFVPKGKLPSGALVIGRMLALCRQPHKGHTVISRDEASKIVAKELMSD